MINYENPLIIQSDQTILLEVNNKKYKEVRNKISSFAELVKSPEHIHTYKISAISLWNAASIGKDKNTIINCLEKYTKYEIPQNIISYITNTINKFGQIKLIKTKKTEILHLVFANKNLVKEIENNKLVKPYLKEKITDTIYSINLINRGTIKHKLIQLNYPVEDWSGFVSGEKYNFKLKEKTGNGEIFKIRNYQEEASEVFFQNNKTEGGHGVIVLPCGSGKTIVGILTMYKLQTLTLVLTSNVASCHQWIREILDKTTIPEEDIGEFTSEKKEIKKITVSTYQMLIHRVNKNDDFPNFAIFQEKDWGLIIYDEVHLLPAPVFSITSNIQSKRRLGLTATLIREDQKHIEVFSLIGPKRYDVPWKELEKKGVIAKAICYEVRIKFEEEDYLEYIRSSKNTKFKIACLNKNKIHIIQKLIKKHSKEKILIIGNYIEQLKEISKKFEIPLIIGTTKNSIREDLYKNFRESKIHSLVVSRVANFAIDLPDASIAIQVSSSYGSRQEEAQRLGRILRPKEKTSYFYSLVTNSSIEEDFNHKRQLFLTEQGYEYRIINAENIKII